MQTFNKTIVEATKLPKIVRLTNNLYCASFNLMKLLPAKYILMKAQNEGIISRNSTIVETSSGTFGLGLAIVCALEGYNLILVSDPAIDEPLKRRLQELGAHVEILEKPSETAGYQGARLERLHEILDSNPDFYWPSQYDNPWNADSYAQVSELIAETIGEIDIIVGPVGSGGSMCGTTKYLRHLFPDLKAVGVDTYGSVLFGQKDQKRLLRGLGNSIMPKNLDHTIFDDVHWVKEDEAFCYTRILHKIHALYMGATSGAAYMVANWYASHNPDSKIVVMFPDEGYRYQSTVYNDKWLQDNGIYVSNVFYPPRFVSHPSHATSQWSAIHWERRTLEQVTGLNICV